MIEGRVVYLDRRDRVVGIETATGVQRLCVSLADCDHLADRFNEVVKLELTFPRTAKLAK